MNTRLKDSQAAMLRFIEIADDHAAVLNANITALLARLKLKVAEVDLLGINQADGSSTRASGARLRRVAAKALRQWLVDLAEMARLIDRTSDRGLAARVPAIHGSSYQALQDRVGATVKALTPVKADFIANGFAPTFLEEITALAALLNTATSKKYDGLNAQVQSTATLKFAVKAGVTLMRSILTALRPVLRSTDPGLLASFKAAAHIRVSDGSKKKSGPIPPTPLPKEPAPTPKPGSTTPQPTTPVAAPVVAKP